MNVISYFSQNGSPKTGLSATIKIMRVPSGQIIISAGVMTEISDGFYYYDFSSYDYLLDYVFICDGSDTLTGSERYVISSNENFIVDYVKAKVKEIMTTDQTIELSSMPTSGSPLGDKLTFLFEYFKNKRTVSQTEEKLFKEDGSTQLGTSLVNDTGTLFTKGEMI